MTEFRGDQRSDTHKAAERGDCRGPLHREIQVEDITAKSGNPTLAFGGQTSLTGNVMHRRFSRSLASLAGDI
jgi:hypothetical protein